MGDTTQEFLPRIGRKALSISGEGWEGNIVDLILWRTRKFQFG